MALLALGYGLGLPLMGGVAGTGGVVGGAFTLNFATLTAAQLRSRFGWSRDSAGAATYIDSDGLVRYGAHNLLLQTATALSPWQKDSYVGTPVAGQPDSAGGTAAISVRSNDASPGLHRVYQGLTLVSGALMTWDIEIKPVGSYTVAEISAHDGVATNSCYVECSGSGSVLFAGAGNSVLVTAKSNGFYRVQVSRIAASSAGYITAQTTDGSGNSGPETPVGEGFDYAFPSVYFGGPNEALPTTSAARYEIRAQDYSAGVAGLLLEGARTNLLPYSNTLSSWQQQGICTAEQNEIGVDGSTSAWTLTDADVGSYTGRYRTLASLSSGAYSITCYVGKTTGSQLSYPVLSFDNGASISAATIDTSNGTATLWTAYTGLSVHAVQSAACVSHDEFFWKVTLVLQTVSTSTYYLSVWPAAAASATKSSGSFNDDSITGSAVFTSFQLEAGAYPTSPIPNATAGTMTRAADDAAISGAEFDALIDPLSGTLVFEFYWSGGEPIGGVFSLNDGTTSNRLDYRAGQNYGIAQKSGGGNAGIYPGGPSIGLNKLAVSWSAAGVAYSINGGTPASDSGNFEMSAVTRLRLGALDSGSQHLNNSIQSVRSLRGQYITGAELQALTA